MIEAGEEWVEETDIGGGWGDGWSVLPTSESLSLGIGQPWEGQSPRVSKVPEARHQNTENKKEMVNTPPYPLFPLLISVSGVGGVTNHPLAQARHLVSTDPSTLLRHTPPLLAPRSPCRSALHL